MPAIRKILKEATIRMYRPGLGDCFLLTFTSTAGKKHTMLIDCGVLQGTEEGADRMRKIAANIQAATGGKIDTVVATHEHWDHVCGFRFAKTTFFGPSGKPQTGVSHEDRITPGEVWLAWTENTSDPQVVRILERNKKLTLAIQSAALAMEPAERERLTGLLKFSGYFSLDAEGFGAREKSEGGKFISEIMNNLRAWNTEPIFLEPGTTRELPGFAIKIHILAPSRKLRQFAGSPLPSPQTDTKSLRANSSNAFLAAALHAAEQKSGFTLGEGDEEGLSKADLDELTRLTQPFDETKAIALTAIDTHEHYGAFFTQGYGKPDESWRKIDSDWMGVADAFALQQVSNVNNTSLVLAIELLESKRVLLFAGDAELESWKAWESGDADLDDLLRRTVLYKVAHHGSVNATVLEADADKPSLSKMTHPDLVALIPVDKDQAAKEDWDFPEQRLYDTLREKTHDRVLLNCETDCRESDPTYIAARFGRNRIRKDDSPDKLWVEYRLPLRGTN